MMHELLESVKGLVREELSRATEQHGTDYHSLHEAYAVLKEKVEETQYELENMLNDFAHLWNATKRDSFVMARNTARAVQAHAMHAACEAIQIAAVAQKVLKTIDRFEKEMQHE